MSRLFAGTAIILVAILFDVPPARAFLIQGSIGNTERHSQVDSLGFRAPRDGEKTDGGIEIVTSSPVIVLCGAVNGNQANVLFDTGSWPNFIGSHKRDKLNGPIETVSPSSGNFEVCSSSNLRLGKQGASNTGRICIVDLAPMTSAVGVEIDAIAGIPFWIGRVVEIDFKNSKFNLSDEPTGRYEFAEDLEFDKFGRPWVEIEIGTRKARFLIDTGFDGYLSVNQTIADFLKVSKLGEDSGHAEYKVYSDGVTSTKENTFTLKRQTIFGAKFADMPVSISAKSDSPNKIGLKVLKNFDVALDFKFGKLRLNTRKQKSLLEKAEGSSRE